MATPSLFSMNFIQMEMHLKVNAGTQPTQKVEYDSDDHEKQEGMVGTFEIRAQSNKNDVPLHHINLQQQPLSESFNPHVDFNLRPIRAYKCRFNSRQQHNET